MKIAYAVLLSFILAKCQSNDRANNHEFLNLDAIQNSISYEKENIIYSKWDTSVCIFNIEEKTIKFSEKLKDLCYSKPILKKGKIYFPYSNNKFVCKEMKSGKLLWVINIKGRCSNFDFVDDTTIIASIKHHGIMAFSTEKGKLMYELKYNYEETSLPDLSPWLISYDSQNFYVSNWQGNTLTSFKKKNGRKNWSFKNKLISNAGPSMIVGSKIFVGINESYKSGKIFLLNKSNGVVLYEQAYQYEDKELPLFFNNSLYFYSYDRFINRYDPVTNTTRRITGFGEGFDLSGNQMFLYQDKLFFSDTSFFLNSFSIKTNTLKQLYKLEKNIIGVYGYKGKLYFIN